MSKQLQRGIVVIALIAGAYFAYTALSDTSIQGVRMAVLSVAALLAGLLLVEGIRE